MGFERIDDLLNGVTADGTLHGVAAAVVGRDGVLYQGAAGDAKPDSMFRNASMTKAVATTAALQLVEQSRVQLDAPVASILPEFGALQVLDGFDGGEPVLRAPKTPPTVRQLMTHTAGCGYHFLNDKLFTYCTGQGFPNPLEGVKRSLSAPLVHDPGTVWEYGVSTDWLGLVVEAVSGQTLADYLAEHVYGPLKMTDSTFILSDEQRARLLPIRFRTPDGALVATDLDLPAESEWDAAGHGSYGTVADYGRFMRAWLNGGELDGARILREETVELALRDHLDGASLPKKMEPTIPELAKPVELLDVPQGWGLGFHLYLTDLPGMRSAGSADWSGLFNSFFWIDRKAGIGAVIATQLLPFFDDKVVETILGFEAAVYAELGASAS
ncbi:serine hydrolase domain-containing protein [Mycolicibacterium holsaticum]|uniref:serine hydrolase domain-containing protein n=1 Tax=Mycolicibacterium holsaticum TaxID=152142 RepID=UPI001C7D6686|nr:serine hydrolase domain-containing protein [Mycolicibacterium holsaticum]MDA4110249.1 beta-lactamase [Mycolicibacterium holsaticum DSM 44478 = JCM 12374]QZA11856.1 beta-lactamase family protein [Mycolicibacterium holsaticum DSM 44478 = JCM 12374]UNC10655.1 beta-lactamase family protein [Mycolicibacterium holsaticum DSM 44478 = JCM 12374]